MGFIEVSIFAIRKKDRSYNKSWLFRLSVWDMLRSPLLEALSGNGSKPIRKPESELLWRRIAVSAGWLLIALLVLGV